MEAVSHVVDQELKGNKAKLEWIITKIINPIIIAIQRYNAEAAEDDLKFSATIKS